MKAAVGGTGVEEVHPLEKGLMMDGLQGCQACSKRLRTILAVPNWQKQMAEVEFGSHCYELPDSDAFQDVVLFGGLQETCLTE